MIKKHANHKLTRYLSNISCPFCCEGEAFLASFWSPSVIKKVWPPKTCGLDAQISMNNAHLKSNSLYRLLNRLIPSKTATPAAFLQKYDKA